MIKNPCLDPHYKYFGFYLFNNNDFDFQNFISLTPQLPQYAFQLDDSALVVLWRSYELLGSPRGFREEIWGNKDEQAEPMPLHLLFDYFSHLGYFCPTATLISIVPDHLHRVHQLCEVPAINLHDFSSSNMSAQGMRVFIDKELNIKKIFPQHQKIEEIQIHKSTVNHLPFKEYCTDGITRLRILLSFINDAPSYRRWYPDVYRAYHLFAYWYNEINDSKTIRCDCEDISMRMNRMDFQEWYIIGECWKALIPLGLQCVYIEDLECYAIYDYQPNKARRFSIENFDNIKKKMTISQTDSNGSNLEQLLFNATYCLHFFPKSASSFSSLYLQDESNKLIGILKINQYPYEIDDDEEN